MNAHKYVLFLLRTIAVIVDTNNPDSCKFDDVDAVEDNEKFEGLIEFIYCSTYEKWRFIWVSV